MNVLSCEQAAILMPAYETGELPSSQAETLMSHLLGCPRCYSTLWKPYYQGAMGQVDTLLEALAEDSAGPLSHAGAEALTWVGSARRSPPADPLASVPWVLEAETPAGPVGGPALRCIGRLLPFCPEGVEAYSLYLGMGEPALEPQAQTPVLLKVMRSRDRCRLSLEPRAGGARLDGASLPPRREVWLEASHILEAGETVYLMEVVTPGRSPWPGAGLLRYRGARFALKEGAQVVGRQPGPGGICLPDRAISHHLELQPEAEEDGALYLDRYEVSRRHAVLTLEAEAHRCRVQALAPVVVRSFLTTTVLSPEGASSATLEDGAEVLIGQRLFKLEWKSVPSA